MTATSPNHPDFFFRATGSTDEQYHEMLTAIGCDLDVMLDEALPAKLPRCPDLDIEALSPHETVARLNEWSNKNKPLRPMLGMGFVRSVMPAPIRRHVLENAGWYTAYTPYQPEISQGRLEALLNFQHLICDLTGMEMANASLLDEASAAGEAMLMAWRKHPRATTFVIHAACNPAIKTVLTTRATPLGISIVEMPLQDICKTEFQDDVFGVMLSCPDTWGTIYDLEPVISHLHRFKITVAVNCDPLALIHLVPPARQGADIVFGHCQSFGLPLGYGGPHAGYIACTKSLSRSLPGRIVGVSHDRNGKSAYRLSMQTREQHIRRDRATSNICTAQSLPAILTSMYAVYHGIDGLRAIASSIHRYAVRFASELKTQGWTIESDHFFNIVTLTARDTDKSSLQKMYQHARDANFALRLDDQPNQPARLSVAFDESFTDEEWSRLMAVFTEQGASDIDAGALNWPKHLIRTDTPLDHPTFRRYQSETEFMRYCRQLMDKDLALDRTMIPLGSCTMKLNPSLSMETLSLQGFSDVHPYEDTKNLAGYSHLFDDLASDLGKLTGMDRVSLQPNAGSQGELAGLLAIRRYFQAKGEYKRNICLIAESAHGTNWASAVGAGFSLKILACRADGQADYEAIKKIVTERGDEIAAFMFTYPSTHGVFDEDIGEAIDLVKSAGAQIYLDGANLNAMLGLFRPGDIGADVCHLNLHKTFAIPHGGGGPGIGPIGVKKHLTPFLPGDPLVKDSGAVCSSLYGSASLLPITWSYIKMLGFNGLKKSSIRALLNANYIAEQLDDYFPIVYRGARGRLAHECILDCRWAQQEAAVTVEDIAKRLIDYGFHAPTMSWPVAGTLMVEATEAEGKHMIDLFIMSMKAIYKEIKTVANGSWPKDDNPLLNAPHVLDDLLAEDWSHPYSKRYAFRPIDDSLPAATDREFMNYIAPVARVDQAYGDRNLFCSCPLPESFLVSDDDTSSNQTLDRNDNAGPHRHQAGG